MNVLGFGIGRQKQSKRRCTEESHPQNLCHTSLCDLRKFAESYKRSWDLPVHGLCMSSFTGMYEVQFSPGTLLFMCYDLLLASDSGHISILILLHLSAAFNIVYHTTVLGWMSEYLGLLSPGSSPTFLTESSWSQSMFPLSCARVRPSRSVKRSTHKTLLSRA